ncbi:hypothetical protein HD806DRAFT_544829 [Xylariaceae sp. AK1471]|nr:hypothetical protein HD806DRAFT_544829 [Xylariaceae sp. AK1471]
MTEQWDLDTPTPEVEKETYENYEKENEEALLKRKRFNWLSRDNHGTSYISYNQFSHLPASSFEFGADGFAGACNSGGELLHLSAPSKEHGLIFARGAFSSSLYACISRAQMEYGGSATFGLRLARDQPPYIPPTNGLNKSKLQTQSQFKQDNDIHSLSEKRGDPRKGSSFRLGEMMERGCFNYRWPLNEYSLLLNSLPEGKDNPDIEVGTCTRFSYVQNGVCYQVIRLEQRCRPQINQEDPSQLFPLEGQVVLEIGGSVYLQLLKSFTATSDQENDSNTHIKNQSSTECLRIMDENLNIGLEARVYQVRADEGRPILLDLKPSLNDQDMSEIRQPSRSPQPSCSKLDSSESTFSTHGSSIPLPIDTGTNDEAPVHLVYRAAAELHPLSKQSGGYMNRSETFIAAIRLVQGGDTTATGTIPEVPSSEDMHKEVWIEPVRPSRWLETSSQATGVMWETILQWRDLHTDSTSEFIEISLMARCLEKILQVDLVPGFYGTDSLALAAISNPFMHPTVSLRSLFWKVRFLVKIHIFLARLEKNHSGRASPQLPNNKDEGQRNQQGEKANSIREIPAFFSEYDGYDRSQMLNIATSQCNRIRVAIENIIYFLVELLSPSEASAEREDFAPLRPQCPTDQSEFYYITMTIWYVVKSFPKFKWISTSRLRNFSQEDMTRSCIPPDIQNFGAVDKRRIILLKWYHYGSLISLADRGIITPSWRSAAMKKRVYSLSNAATVACTGRTASKSHYSVDDEIVDRLSFLAHELGMEEFDATAETVTSASIQRVRGREFTKYLNPGVSLLNGRGYTFQETFGPWEIHALCHNSRVNMLTMESESEYVRATRDCRGSETREEEVTVYKDKVYQFLNSEATLIPCWERSPTKMRSGWLQSEAAAVHGSTLLDIHNHIPIIPRLSPKNSPENGPMFVPPISQHRRLAGGFTVGIPGGLDKDLVSAQFRGILKELKGKDVCPIDWASFRPPRQYHPDNFINSLEDTPHLFRSPVTNNVFIPAALALFAERPDKGGFSRHDLENVLDKAPGSLSMLDILAFQQTLSSRKVEPSGRNNTTLPDMRYYPGVPSPGDSDLLPKPTHGQRALIWTFPGQNPLVRALFDSLVDQSVQHRVLHVHKLTEKLIQMLAFVIHPEAVTCLSNHVLHTPRFSFQKGPTWMMTITVGSWVLINGESRTLKHGGVMANESLQVPGELKDRNLLQSGNSALNLPQCHVSFFASSAVLSTNAFGDFSRCTLISEINDSKRYKVDDDNPNARPIKPMELAETSNEIWQVFVHQPQTARCLVFLQVLGILCTGLCEQYRSTIKEFASIVDSRDAFLLKDADRTHDRSSLPQLQLIIWSLDCLYRFQNSLKTSFNNILDAKSELLGQINEQAANRSQPLQGMCQEYVAKFESSIVELTQVIGYLEINIALAERFKDGVGFPEPIIIWFESRSANSRFELSGILALMDSGISLEQNEISLDQNKAIQALTYLTIGYLPLGLIAAIFAIPKEQNVVHQAMGKWWFVGAVLIISAVTYSVVAWLNDIVDFFKFPTTPRTRRPDKRPNLWNLLGFRRTVRASDTKSPC